MCACNLQVHTYVTLSIDGQMPAGFQNLPVENEDQGKLNKFLKGTTKIDQTTLPLARTPFLEPLTGQ
jgi:hypothetical protein